MSFLRFILPKLSFFTESARTCIQAVIAIVRRRKVCSFVPMKILIGNQIREADRCTIEREPVASIDLMERASEAIAQWTGSHIPSGTPLRFFVGKGNNGGDGLAVARMLCHAGFDCTVQLVFDRSALSGECRCNLERLPGGVRMVEWEEVPADAVIVDAILGTGVQGKMTGPALEAVTAINALPNRVISIDLPSGMRTEFGNAGETMIRADVTLTPEFPKLAMLLPEAGEACGKVEVLPLGLDRQYIAEAETPYHYLTREAVRALLHPRPKFGHKGSFGHALLICGSEGMIGAGILSLGAALRSGCGLVTLHAPREERAAIQANYPSALLSLDPGRCFTQQPADLERYDAIGTGCGLGLRPETGIALGALLANYRRPVALDADALTFIAGDAALLRSVPAGSILTPHPGELRRLIGAWEDEAEKIARSTALAAELQSVVVVKGAHTMICLPSGEVWFNSTGTPGMAKGGSGDVLTGLLAGLLARGYGAVDAARIGVYLHGLAGEKCADRRSEEAMNSADLIDSLAEAWREII